MSEPQLMIPHIPGTLNSLEIPLEKWLSSHQKYKRVIVGAFIVAYRHSTSAHGRQPYLLIVRRAAEDTSPGCWEIPWGTVEPTDSTILDAVAREVSEETGFHLTQFVEQIGEGVSHWSEEREDYSLRLPFEIEVSEIPAYMTAGGSVHNCGEIDSDGPVGITSPGDIPVHLNPPEHQDHVWVTEEDLIMGKETGKYVFVRESLYQVLLDGFAQHKARLG